MSQILSEQTINTAGSEGHARPAAPQSTVPVTTVHRVEVDGVTGRREKIAPR